MPLLSEPLVSVVTPIYNAEKYLAQCIESVLAQSYSNWEYIIVNNCSTDRSLAIAEEYRQRNARIRIVNNREFLPLMANWNHALRQISPRSVYCKVVHADDWLFPECLASMVEVAAHHPTVGIVSAYRLNEDRVDLDGLPFPSTVMAGHTVGRLTLGREQLFLFGSPTSILIRSDLIRATEKFYDESLLHADTDACFRLLQQSDFGFVHQVLTYTRRHNESITSKVKQLETIHAELVRSFMRYGSVFLDEEEVEARRQEVISGYYRMLARHVLRRTAPEFWRYHRSNMAALGIGFHWEMLARPLFFEIAHALLHIKHTTHTIVRHHKDTPSSEDDRSESHNGPRQREIQREIVQGN